MNTKPRMLVTSAAGRTGSAAVLELLKKGFPVRAFVRRRDARSEALKNAGAEIFVGDLFDFRDLRRALADVQRAYYCPPYAPNLLNGAMLFALAAEETGLEVVALLSGWNPHPTHPSVVTRENFRSAVRCLPRSPTIRGVRGAAHPHNARAQEGLIQTRGVLRNLART